MSTWLTISRCTEQISTLRSQNSTRIFSIRTQASWTGRCRLSVWGWNRIFTCMQRGTCVMKGRLSGTRIFKCQIKFIFRQMVAVWIMIEMPASCRSRGQDWLTHTPACRKVSVNGTFRHSHTTLSDRTPTRPTAIILPPTIALHDRPSI